MTYNDVVDFLIVNGWGVTTSGVHVHWTHSKIRGYCVLSKDITIDPNKEFTIICDLMQQFGLTIVHHTATSQQYNGINMLPTIQATQPTIQATQSFVPRAITLPPLTPLYSPSTLKSISCDCGAIKCKSTHYHWCSTMKGNSNGR